MFSPSIFPELHLSGGTFGPAEIDLLQSAFVEALARVTDDEEVEPRLAPLEIRRRVAAGIVGAAIAGRLEHGRLVAAGLATIGPGAAPV